MLYSIDAHSQIYILYSTRHCTLFTFLFFSIVEVQDWGNNRMSNGQNSPIDVSNTVNDTKMQIMDSSVCDLVPVKSLVTETISPRCQAYKAYPSHNLREDWAREQREQWILKMLEVFGISTTFLLLH